MDKKDESLPQLLSLERKFIELRRHTIGHNATFTTPYGEKTVHYFDWTASGRLYKPIEEALTYTFGPFVGNTHSQSSETGMDMTIAYEKAREIIKKHVHADDTDVLLFTGTGTTGAINKLQKILGLKFADQLNRFASFAKLHKDVSVYPAPEKPVVFITRMEHHSNHISWEETNADVVLVDQNTQGNIDTGHLHKLLIQYKNRKLKIGAFTACSNVTGILTPIETLAQLMHQYDGYCFIDFAAAAPYIPINMHPKDPKHRLDAIYFSPHKFLGGPGSSGILVFSQDLYPKHVPPETPGGGTVAWTNPWGGRRYYDDIQLREDGGTPGFLQAIRAALAIQLKEQMHPPHMVAREKTLLTMLLDGLHTIPNLHILGENNEEKLGIVSFYIDTIHYNLVVKLLNDKYGIQTRGGCSCAGTYGHYLLGIDKKTSARITNAIDMGDVCQKPGWVRVSLHPTLLEEEIELLIVALKEIAMLVNEWKQDYVYDMKTNEFVHKDSQHTEKAKIEQWFEDALLF
jgi:selenocysteine lyase/cysteine desulfurase